MTHADEDEAFTLEGRGNRLHREADNAEGVFDAVGFQSTDQYRRSINLCQ